MRKQSRLPISVLLVAIFAPTMPALARQTAPVVRQITAYPARSSELFGAVSQVRVLSNGDVIVNDNASRRVVLLDTALRLVRVIADTTAATARLYGSGLGGLIQLRGDSSFFVDPSSLSMLLLDGNGNVVRTLAIPRPSDAGALIGGPFGAPRLDREGRLVYRGAVRWAYSAKRGMPEMPDSAPLLRVSLTSRHVDTLTYVAIPRISMTVAPRGDDGHSFRTVAQVSPLAWADDWAVLSDGSIAVIRGRAYSVEFLDTTNHWSPRAKIPFDWRRLKDEDKSAIIDSTRLEMVKIRTSVVGLGDTANDTKVASRTRRSPQLQSPSPSAPRNSESQTIEFVPLSEMPDYVPAFRQGAALGDDDGHLWIRTTTMFNGSNCYDVVDHRGNLLGRVALPSGRMLVGFGPHHVVYMGVLDGASARLERATTSVP
ncbi:MAG: hypothetical protein ACREN6_03950 [Gemmatimonadaceae bacterium]